MSSGAHKSTVPKPKAQFRQGIHSLFSFLSDSPLEPPRFGKGTIEDMKLAQSLLNQLKRRQGF